jgi:hypothetical protein
MNTLIENAPNPQINAPIGPKVKDLGFYSQQQKVTQVREPDTVRLQTKATDSRMSTPKFEKDQASGKVITTITNHETGEKERQPSDDELRFAADAKRELDVKIARHEMKMKLNKLA